MELSPAEVILLSAGVSLLCLLAIVLINLLLWYWTNHVRFIRGKARCYKSRSTQTGVLGKALKPDTGNHVTIQGTREVGNNSAYLHTDTDDQSPYAELHAPDIGLSSHYVQLHLGTATFSSRSSNEVTQETEE